MIFTIKKKILKWLMRHDPELCGEIFSEDFVGIVPKRTVDNNALRFLQKNANVMEPWILWMNHQLQREQTLYGKKLRNPGFYEGAMFVLKILYTKVIRYVPKNTSEPLVVKQINNPLAGVEEFERGFKEKNDGEKNNNAESESGEVQSL